MQTILVVEDERQIAEIAGDYLRRAGFAVVVAANGESALELARARHADLIVLDLGLPRVDGLDVARTLRRESDVPIIMLTARVEESDRLARPRAGRRRLHHQAVQPARAGRAGAGRAAAGDTPRHGERSPAARRPDARRAAAQGDARRRDAIELTATEFQLLAVMARQPGRVFTRAQLLDAVRGKDGESFDRAIDAHVKNIRRKIERDPRVPRYVETVYGIGYRCAEL